MRQLYFLSILCNGLCGYILFAVNEGGGAEDSLEKNIRFSLNTPTFHLVLGILCGVTGILKLLSPVVEEGKGTLYIFGDFLPAAIGVIAGIILIFGIYRQDISAAPENPGTLDHLGISLLNFRKPIGIGLIGIALLHFIFAELPLL